MSPDPRVDERGPWIVPSHYDRLCKRIDKKVQRAGGLRVANALLGLMSNVGRVQDSSLIHARTPQMSARRQPEPGTPWHYLYSLAMKHLGVPTKSADVSNVIQPIYDLSRILAAALNVEPHSSFEGISIGGANFAKTLNDTLVYDEMFAFPQWQPLAARTLLPNWFSALEAEGCTLPSASSADWSALAAGLLVHSHPNAVVPVQSADLTGHGLSHATAERLFAACCATSTNANTTYSRPSDTAFRTSNTYPILRGERGRTFVQPRGVVARALCERIYALMRHEAVADLENRMGRALERLTASILQSAGHSIALRGGKYANPQGGNDLEVDLAVETPERIYLFECKKKALTSAARRGETLASLRDLEKSFLSGLQQLARHEAALRSRRDINFRDGTVISLGGRTVEKFCISLFDHGSMQYRDMTMAMLELLVGCRITIDDVRASEVEAAVNKRLRCIHTSLRSIIDTQEGSEDAIVHSFAMSTWWLSVDQLQYAILKGGDLWSGIERVRHLTRSSGDLIYDIVTTARLNEVEGALFSLSKKMNNRSLV